MEIADVVYQAIVSSKENTEKKKDIDVKESPLKQRSYTKKNIIHQWEILRQHKTFRHIWTSKNQAKTHQKMTWKIRTAPTYNKASKHCKLCLEVKKIAIITIPEINDLWLYVHANLFQGVFCWSEHHRNYSLTGVKLCWRKLFNNFHCWTKNVENRYWPV